MDQLNSGGTDVISYASSGTTSSTTDTTNQLNVATGSEPQVDTQQQATINASEANNENINPIAGQPIKMDINNLLSQIMSITSQSLKDAQERFVIFRAVHFNRVCFGNKIKLGAITF